MSGDRLVLHTRVITGGGGGPEKTIVNSPRFLKKQGYPMLCAYMRAPDDKGFESLLVRGQAAGATIIPVDDNGPLDWRIARRFKQICGEHRPAIWHAHDYKSNFFGLLANRHTPMKLITTAHGYVEQTWKTPIYYGLDRFVLKFYDHVICVSEDLHSFMLERGIAEERCSYIPNGIDTEEYRRTQPSIDAKRRAGVPEGRMVIGAVGRLSPEKGFDLLLQAFASMCVATGADCELWIAGEGSEKARLAVMIEELGLVGRAKLLGFTSDIHELFAAMDGFVLSSLREGIPNVVLEAMAMEVPMVCTRVAGVPNVMDDEKEGLLIDCGSTPALEAALTRLVTEPSLRISLAKAARARVERRHSFSLRMQRIKDVYERVLGDLARQ
jgi:glycosyltransferase involved in cell wall biosynthesis